MRNWDAGPVLFKIENFVCALVMPGAALLLSSRPCLGSPWHLPSTLLGKGYLFHVQGWAQHSAFTTGPQQKPCCGAGNWAWISSICSSKCSALAPLLSLLCSVQRRWTLTAPQWKHQLKTLLLKSATSLLVQFEGALTEVRLRCSDHLLMRVFPGSSHTLTLQPASLLFLYSLWDI